MFSFVSEILYDSITEASINRIYTLLIASPWSSTPAIDFKNKLILSLWVIRSELYEMVVAVLLG